MKKSGWLWIVFAATLLVGCGASAPKKSSGKDADQAYSRLGFQYLQSGDTANAKKSFHRALEINDGYAEAHNGLALTFQLEGDTDLAEKYFRQATSLAPGSAMMHNNFGAFLFANQRYDEACKELARATEDPFYNRRAQAFENLGRCYQFIDRQDAAKHAFKRALQIGANRPVALIELSSLLLDENTNEEAENYYARFLKLLEERRVEHYAKSLWVGIRLARVNGKATRAATLGLILKNLYPESDEYRAYKESAR